MKKARRTYRTSSNGLNEYTLGNLTRRRGTGRVERLLKEIMAENISHLGTEMDTCCSSKDPKQDLIKEDYLRHFIIKLSKGRRDTSKGSM